MLGARGQRSRAGRAVGDEGLCARPHAGQARAAPDTRPTAGPVRADPYAVLGLDRGAGERDIKRAYRKLMSQHHPDKLGDVPEELKHRAEDRAREINAAYERIKTERGFK